MSDHPSVVCYRVYLCLRGISLYCQPIPLTVIIPLPKDKIYFTNPFWNDFTLVNSSLDLLHSLALFVWRPSSRKVRLPSRPCQSPYSNRTSFLLFFGSHRSLLPDSPSSYPLLLLFNGSHQLRIDPRFR